LDINFYYNGKSSEEIGVYLVSLESGLQTRPYLAEREIISEQIMGNDIPYVYGVRYNPLTFKLTLSCLEGAWTFEKRREIARWLDIQQFAEFYTADNPSQIYYLMYHGGIDLSYDGELKGYIELEMVNISPYTYSPVYIEKYDLSTISSPTFIEFTNKGDNDLKPEIWIYKIGAGDLSIINYSNGGKEFKFTSLADKETLYVDCFNRHIETDIPLTYRYDNFNGEYLVLPRGVNRLLVSSKCQLKFRYQFEFKG
jgi:phage-related protein